MASVPSFPSEVGGWRLVHRYAALPESLHVAVAPTPVAAPRMVMLNRRLAADLGLDPEVLAGEDGAAWLSGNRLPPGASPRAQAYAGHQYGHFTFLGDGRAILLGEQCTPGGSCFDVQLKGAGPTPFSRRGDGRAALGPMLREYLVSEAMHALGIPSTRSLAVVATGDTVWRDRPLPGAVLTRVATSHLRVGTFQGAAALRDEAALRALVEHALRLHYPDRIGAENPALALLQGVIDRQATLIAQWMQVGFVHGVMNTDNMAISGETIDYGPCAFMEAYDPETVFSSIDRHGRYAYGNQPVIAQWNLTRFAEALLPLLHPTEAAAIDLAKAALAEFGLRHREAMLAGFRRKLGLFNAEAEDAALIESLLAAMAAAQADFTTTFSALAAGLTHDDLAVESVDRDWLERWRARLARQPETKEQAAALARQASPRVIPRNLRVEAALSAAEDGDLTPFEHLLEVLASPYDYDRPHRPEDLAPSRHDEPYTTFCGT